MGYIPYNTKISLINKYIQINIINTQGKGEHDDHSIGEILKEISDDLKKFHETANSSNRSLGPVLHRLKKFQEVNDHPPVKLDALIEDLQSLIESIGELKEFQTNPELDIKSIIEELDNYHKAQSGEK